MTMIRHMLYDVSDLPTFTALSDARCPASPLSQLISSTPLVGCLLWKKVL